MTLPWDNEDGGQPSTATPPTTPPPEQTIKVDAETITAISKERNFTSIKADVLKDLQKLGIIKDVMGIEQIEGGIALVSSTAALDVITRIHTLANRDGLTDKEKFRDNIKAAHPIGYLMNAIAKLMVANQRKDLPPPLPPPEKTATRTLDLTPAELPIAKLPG